MLWFDVEKRYNTTNDWINLQSTKLWFDVEKRYNTTITRQEQRLFSCGLM